MTADGGRTGWSAVWNDRPADLADWNGYEACFPDRAAYESHAGAMTAFVGDTLRIGPHDVVLDLGCGSGLIAYGIAERASSVTALDYSTVALDVARERRPRPNLCYDWADLNAIDPATLPPATKAYAIGSLLYLDANQTAFRLVDALVGRGTEVLLTDLPDASLTDTRKRHYDTTEYRHLRFAESEFRRRYPSAAVSIHRNLFPGYVNDAVRFTVHITP